MPQKIIVAATDHRLGNAVPQDGLGHRLKAGDTAGDVVSHAMSKDRVDDRGLAHIRIAGENREGAKHDLHHAIETGYPRIHATNRRRVRAIRHVVEALNRNWLRSEARRVGKEWGRK